MVNTSTGTALVSESELIRELQQGDPKAMEYLYRHYWPAIAHFVWLNQGQQQEAEDLFQDGILVLYEKLLQRDFVLQCSLKTYLYAICRNQWLKRLRARKHFMIRDTMALLENIPDLQDPEEADLPGDQELRQVLENLKDPCYRMIIGFYYEKRSLEQLALELGYATANVAKQIKFRCLERLRKRLGNAGEVKP